MAISGAFMEEISQALKVDRETLLAQGIASRLQDKKRVLMLERLQRLAHDGVPSREALERAIQAGQVAEHPQRPSSLKGPAPVDDCGAGCTV
jgi:hypothetical protein